MSEGNERQQMASRLRLARERAGLSQGQAAKLLEMHRPTVSEVEAGRRRVQAEELSRFASLYAVSVEWLLGREEAPDVLVAARELERLKPDDREKVLDLIRSLARGDKK